jgi:hypothetical protein
VISSSFPISINFPDIAVSRIKTILDKNVAADSVVARCSDSTLSFSKTEAALEKTLPPIITNVMGTAAYKSKRLVKYNKLTPINKDVPIRINFLFNREYNRGKSINMNIEAMMLEVENTDD